VFNAQASSEPLPDLSPTALLADVQTADVPGFSGTIVAQLSLGLPELPALGGAQGGASMASLLSGSHTMRFWYGGADRQRVALLGTTDETDVFHSGRDLWQWDSDDHVATHTVLPAERARRPDSVATDLTPQQVAKRALAAIDPSTRVTVEHDRLVADRSVYELVLTPRETATRVGSVRIAVDGSTKMPLGVQVYARGKSSAAIDVSFSHVTFKTPSASNFRFTPPPGATVRRGMQTEQPTAHHAASSLGTGSVTTIGSGWTAIAEYHATGAQVDNVAGPTLGGLTPVHGDWGSGRLLDSALVSVLVTDDGRVFAGAVDPTALYTAAAAHK
jgi:outer membrane lipoprotein-sorting protein